MSTPKRIVEAILGDEDDPVNDFLARNQHEIGDQYRQVGGDYGDPWVHGGAFYNPASQNVVYFRGLEGEGRKDYESSDFDLTEQETAEIMAQFPVAVDPEFPEYGDRKSTRLNSSH